MDSQFVAILGHSHKNRGMILSEYNTRCILKDEVHELVLLKEESDEINFDNAWYLGFIAFKQSGVLAKGMSLTIGGEIIGTLVGFDTTHEPNHYNLLVSTTTPMTGPEMGIQIGDTCLVSMKNQE